MKVARRRGDRAVIEGKEAVVLGRPVNDRGARWYGGRGGVHGFYLRRAGVALDRVGMLVVAGEWHLSKNWGAPAVIYWGNVALAEHVDAAGGIDAFLRAARR